MCRSACRSACRLACRSACRSAVTVGSGAAAGATRPAAAAFSGRWSAAFGGVRRRSAAATTDPKRRWNLWIFNGQDVGLGGCGRLPPETATLLDTLSWRVRGVLLVGPVCRRAWSRSGPGGGVSRAVLGSGPLVFSSGGGAGVWGPLLSVVWRPPPGGSAFFRFLVLRGWFGVLSWLRSLGPPGTAARTPQRAGAPNPCPLNHQKKKPKTPEPAGAPA